MTVLFWDLSLRMTSQTSRRALGSRPVVGSSRNISSGSLTMDMATPTLCLSPPDRFMNQVSLLSCSCTASMSSSAPSLLSKSAPK
ncbi:MAG: hypothetical protein A4E29_01430 [Methanomassiliicoccales archaeon PtaB.Bin134]|nr:MAG: hypothetical protein A4E29_01430 [Methanomassiliicoccales archaeon PtaB.Bin134]